MRLPQFHMSNGAWIFATGVAVSLIASAGVYAAVNSIVAIGNASGTTTAYVTPTRQLQTVTTAPTNLVHAGHEAIPGPPCSVVYAPPAGKAIVVTQVTYDLKSTGEGTEISAALHDPDCDDFPADYGDTIHLAEAQSHTFPTGIPLTGVGIAVTGSGSAVITITGYLIPLTQLPPEAPQPREPIKGMVRR